MPASIRTTSQGFARWAPEVSILPNSATSLPSLPSLSLLGWVDQPSVNSSEGASEIETVGTYRAVEIVRGMRSHTVGLNMRLGNAEILKYGIRNSGIGSAKFRCMPIFTLVTGTTDPCGDGDPFSIAARFCMMNTLSIQFQENQPVTAALQAMAICVDDTAAIQPTATENQVQGAGKSTLVFHHADWIVGGTSYRDYLSSVSLQLNNNVAPNGCRPELGPSNLLSRCPYVLLPGQEKLQISYRLKDMPPFMSRTSSQDMGFVRIYASNAGSSTNPQTVTIDINNNVLSERGLEGVQPGQPFGFSASTIGRYLTIATS